MRRKRANAWWEIVRTPVTCEILSAPRRTKYYVHRRERLSFETPSATPSDTKVSFAGGLQEANVANRPQPDLRRSPPFFSKAVVSNRANFLWNVAIEWISLYRAVPRLREQSYLTARTSVRCKRGGVDIPTLTGRSTIRALPALLTEGNRLTAFFGRVLMLLLVLAVGAKIKTIGRPALRKCGCETLPAGINPLSRTFSRG